MKKIFLLIFLVTVLSGAFLWGRDNKYAAGGTVYVAAYSSVLHGDLTRELGIAVTLSIHNIDLKKRIIIDSIEYYDTSGRLIKSYLESARIMNPLQTFNLGVREKDKRGGLGANFIVRWHGPEGVNSPVIETVMISTKGQQGISFTSRGVTLRE